MGDPRVQVAFECRLGGPADGGCECIAACGCRPTSVEEVWDEAHYEQMAHLAREVFDALAEAIGAPRFVHWVGKRLTR